MSADYLLWKTFDEKIWAFVQLLSGQIACSLVLEQNPTIHRHPPTTWHWTWRKPPSEPPFRLWSQALKPDSYLCRAILCTAEKKSPTSPCNSSIFISQVTQAGRGWREIFSFFKRPKPLALVQCVSSAHWDMATPVAQNWHPVLVWWTQHPGLSLRLTQISALATCKTLDCILCWGQVTKAMFF